MTTPERAKSENGVPGRVQGLPKSTSKSIEMTPESNPWELRGTLKAGFYCFPEGAFQDLSDTDAPKWAKLTMVQTRNLYVVSYDV